MSVAREVIASFKGADCHRVAKTGKELKRNKRTTSSDWVQWGKCSEGVVETYYEVYNPHDEILWVEFHAKRKNFVLKPMNGMKVFTGEYTKGQFMYGTEVDVSDLEVDCAIQIVQSKLDEVYETVEPQLQQCEGDSNSVKRKKVGQRNGAVQNWSADWHRKYMYDKSYLCAAYDKELEKVAGLTWLPWVGKQYNVARLLVVGESNYADKANDETVYEAIKRVNDDRLFTRKMASAFGVERMIENTTFDGITRLLNWAGDLRVIDLESSREVWGKIAYVDILQSALKSGARPREERTNEQERRFWSEGRNVIFRLIELLKPSAVLFVGCTAADWMCGSYHGEKHEWLCRKLACDDRIGKYKSAARLRRLEITSDGISIPVIGIPNPGGAHGFNLETQLKVKRDFLQKVECFAKNWGTQWGK